WGSERRLRDYEAGRHRMRFIPPAPNNRRHPEAPARLRGPRRMATSTVHVATLRVSLRSHLRVTDESFAGVVSVTRRALITGAIAACAYLPAAAQERPNRPLTMLIPTA